MISREMPLNGLADISLPRREHLLAVIDRITDLRELPAFADQLHSQNELSPEIQGAIAHRLARLTRLKAGR